MSSTYTEPRLALSLGGRSIGDAGDRVQRYCGLEAHGDREIWAYEFYDTIRSSPMAVEPVDVVIASGVHPGIARRHLQFFHEMSGELNAWLASIPEPAALQKTSRRPTEQPGCRDAANPSTRSGYGHPACPCPPNS